METTAAPIVKESLSARGRWDRGGSFVRLSPKFVQAQQARDAVLQRAVGVERADVHDRNSYDADTIFVVVDLDQRKTWDRPMHVSVSVPGSGLAFGVPLAEIVEIVTR